MAQKKNSKGQVKKDAKPANKNGKKAEGSSGSSFFTWFMVLALLGVWTSVAVVWFGLVDYDDVLARAKEFRYNISEVLQGKLGAYDADGDGDFDVEDAKVLLDIMPAEAPAPKKEKPKDEKPEEVVTKKDKTKGLKENPAIRDAREPPQATPEPLVKEPEPEPVVEEEVVQSRVQETVQMPPEPAEEDPEILEEQAAEPELELVAEEEEEEEEDEEEVSQPEEEVEAEEPEEEELVESAKEVEEEEPKDETKTVEAESEPEEEEEPAAEVEPEPEVEEEPATEAEPEAEVEAEPEVEEEPAVEAEPEAEVEAEPEVEEEPAVEEEATEEAEVEVEAEPFYEEPQEGTTKQAETVEEEPEPEASPTVDTEQFAGEDAPALEDSDVQDTVDVSEDTEDDVYGSQSMDVESEIQAAVPLPELQDEEFQSVDSPGDDTDAHPYEDHTEAVIDTQGEIVEEAQPEETVAESEEEPETSYEEPDTQAETEAKSIAESEDDAAVEETQEELAEEEPAVAEEQPEVEAEVETPEEHPVEEEEEEDHHQEEPAETTEDQQEKPKEKTEKKKPKLLNKFDKTIKAEINAAEKLRKKGKVQEAVRAFEALVQKYPQSPRCRYGKAQSEDDLAEKMRSNEILQRAIITYGEAAELPGAPADLVKATLKRRADRQQFLGRMRSAMATLEKLVQIFPEDVSLKNDLGVGYLLLGDNKSAKKVYEEVLAKEPTDGFAKVHYGFILKSENKIAESIPFLREGLESGDPGTDDGRFYFHLGDALQRVGDDSAYKWYEIGHQRGHFASVWQRSLYNVNGLKARPWWTAKETGYTDLVKILERNWRTIRDEALAVMDTSKGLFRPEDENLREKGEWGQFTLWQQGRKVENSCRSVPKTCALMERYPEATGCKRGQIKYSVMQPGTHVWPHTGPTNCRLRMHLGLVIPTQGCRIRCTNETRAWEEGKVLIFDDSFEHEVWQEADSYRLIFIVDVWHPELTPYQRKTLSPI